MLKADWRIDADAHLTVFEAQKRGGGTARADLAAPWPDP